VVWGTSLQAEPGLRIPNMFDAAIDGTFKGLFVRYSLGKLLETQDEIAAALQKARSESISTGAMTGIGGLLLASFSVYWLLGRWIRRPLERLVEIMRELGHGHIKERLNIDGKDEIAQMGQAVDSFADTLQNEIVVNLEKLKFCLILFIEVSV